MEFSVLLCVVLDITLLMQFVHTSSLKKLALVSRDVSVLVRKFINNNLTFDLSSSSKVQRVTKVYAPKLVKLDKTKYEDHLPSSVTHLTFRGNYLPPKIFEKLPHLTHLTVSNNCNFALLSLPPNITHLKYFYPNGNVKNPSITSCSIQSFTINGCNVSVSDKNLVCISPEGMPKKLVRPQHLISGISFDNVVSQLLLASDLFSKLGTHSILQLSLVSKSVFKVLYPFINDNLLFQISQNSVPRVYNPKQISNIVTYDQNTHSKIGDISSLADLPPNLTHLTFSFNLPLSFAHLPKITHLTLNHKFNQPIENLLPPNITHLYFDGYYFNKPVDNLPSKLTHLSFDGYWFNLPVDHLPSNLTNLSFSYRFNRPVDNLPSTLTNLSFGDWFNLPVDHLPPRLLFLKFGISFNWPVDKLPSNLQTLIIGEFFSQSINNLPLSIKKLQLGFHFNKKHTKLPPFLTHLTISSNTSHLDFLSANSITHLTISPPPKRIDTSKSVKQVIPHFLQSIEYCGLKIL